MEAPGRLHVACLHSISTHISVPRVTVLADFGNTTRTSLFRIGLNLKADRCISEIFLPVFLPTIETCDRSPSNKTMQDYILHIVFGPSSIHRGLDCNPLVGSLQICHLLETAFETNVVDEVYHRLEEA